MTGIDRLMTLAGEWAVWGLGGALEDVAGQIERERACDEDTIENVRLIVGGVIDDMERHVSGVEGADDSPVARWSRELRDALKSDTSDSADAQNPSWHDPADTADVTSGAAKVTRDPAADVSMSAYDLLPQEDREAIAWVRERGGLDHVKAEWRSRVPYDRYVRRRQSLLSHIAECETALGRRREIISSLGHRVSDLTNENAELRRRAMPEGCEWPRYESGELVQIGDDVVGRFSDDPIKVRSVEFRDGDTFLREGFKADRIILVHPGERVRRPVPKVLDADGVEIREGDTVWHLQVDEPCEWIVVKPYDSYDGFQTALITSGDVTAHARPENLTHRAPVLAADGKPLREGETVWYVPTPDEAIECVVDELPDRDKGEGQVTSKATGRNRTIVCPPSYLTHECPETDSWERLEEDARLLPSDYRDRRGIADVYATEADDARAMARDIVRRCRALAERERGE